MHPCPRGCRRRGMSTREPCPRASSEESSRAHRCLRNTRHLRTLGPGSARGSRSTGAHTCPQHDRSGLTNHESRPWHPDRGGLSCARTAPAPLMAPPAECSSMWRSVPVPTRGPARPLDGHSAAGPTPVAPGTPRALTARLPRGAVPQGPGARHCPPRARARATHPPALRSQLRHQGCGAEAPASRLRAQRPSA